MLSIQKGASLSLEDFDGLNPLSLLNENKSLIKAKLGEL